MARGREGRRVSLCGTGEGGRMAGGREGGRVKLCGTGEGGRVSLCDGSEVRKTRREGGKEGGRFLEF